MNDPILSRESICADAKLAAERFLATGADPLNPHIEGSDAFAQWAADFSRWRLVLIADEGCEGGA